MTESELGLILKNMYSTAPRNEKAVHIHLFGIKYSSIIQENKLALTDIIKYSEIPTSYVSEVHKGFKLSRYVTLK